MAKYPVRITFSDGPKAAKPAPRPVAKAKPQPPMTQARLDSHARRQAEEARESALVRRGNNPNVIRTTINERPTPTKKGR